MKKFNLIVIVLAIFTLILAACGTNDNTNEGVDVDSKGAESNETTELAFEPEDINPDTDVCEICGMAIADDEYATQIVLKNERALKFDDIGDLFVWIEENGEDEIGAKFVRDFNTQEWIQLEDATYVYDVEIDTPMGYGVISFKDSKDAEIYIEENGIGELLSAKDLNDHEWKMDHDHEEHDMHENHDEHDAHDDHENDE